MRFSFAFLLTAFAAVTANAAAIENPQASSLDMVDNLNVEKRQSSSLRQVSNWGENPANVGFYIYVPNNVRPNPAVIVAIHWCGGSAQAYYQSAPYARLADQHGFIVIYPSSPLDGGCWDLSSRETLTRNGRGASNSIANMVRYTLRQYNADASNVFVTGTSSGAMMTNLMAAVYPDLFKAATAYAGVPAGCYVSQTGQTGAWNSTCAEGRSIYSAEHWARVVRDSYPGYNGPRPRFQIYHGSADDVVRPQNYQETVKQWTGVFGFNAQQPQSVQRNVPTSPWTTNVWGVTSQNPLGTVQGILGQGVGHNLPIFGEETLRWFGLI